MASISAAFQISPLYCNSTISSKPKPSIVFLHSNYLLKLQTLRSTTRSTRVLATPELLESEQTLDASVLAAPELLESEQTLDASLETDVSSFDEGEDSETPSSSRIVIEADKIKKQKIRIKLKCYYTNLIEESCKLIMEAAKNTNAKTSGPVPLPTRKRIWCVLKSPFVHKDARMHFEIRTHQRLIDIYPTAETIDSLMHLQLPAGVDIEVKL